MFPNRLHTSIVVVVMMLVNGCTQTLPLDPLTTQDRQLAEQIARQDSYVHDLLGDQSRLISVGLLFVKPGSPASTDNAASIHRHAEVLFFREDTQMGVRVIVDLTNKSVISSEGIPASQVPLTSEDIRKAAKLALSVTEIQQALGEDLRGFLAAAEGSAKGFEIDGLRLLGGSQNNLCTVDRCVRLLFRRGRDYLIKPNVWVDLTDGSVHVERREQ